MKSDRQAVSATHLLWEPNASGNKGDVFRKSLRDMLATLEVQRVNFGDRGVTFRQAQGRPLLQDGCSGEGAEASFVRGDPATY